MKADLLALLLTEWVTPATALRKVRCFSLSQRCGEMRRDREDWERFANGFYGRMTKPPLILDRWVKLRNGKTVKAYRAIAGKGLTK
jgi:hypothetical protein